MADRMNSSGNRGNDGGSGRDRYRDNDDVRQVDDASTRNDVNSDSRNEARGDARETVGNHARDTASDRDRGGDQYDDDLARDNRRGREGEGMSDLARETRSGAAGSPEDGESHNGWRSHARQGQAESPVELTHNEPPHRKEGH